MDYVLIFASKCIDSTPDPLNPRFICVEKDRPDWQKGRYNLVGGKIEEGENPRQAAARELQEETGIKYPESCMFGEGTITCYSKQQGKVVDTVHIFSAWLSKEYPIEPHEGETERVFWANWDDIKHDPKTLPNLLQMIPAIMMGVSVDIVGEV